MAAFIRSLLGQDPTPEPVAPEDDFADFAEAPPSPISLIPSLTGSLPTQPTDGSTGTTVPYTAWYRVWERTSPSDFKTEAIILPFLLLAIAFHIWGTRTNKRKARRWMAVHAPVLETEFALVGYGRHAKKKATGADEVSTDTALIKASANLSGDNLPEGLMKEKSTQDFQSYASGRQNAAFVDLKLTLSKRSNPLMLAAEYLLSLFFESLAPPRERMEAVIYTFDGREKDFIPPAVPGSAEVEKTRGSGGGGGSSSTYDGFVFAIVNKMSMRKLRDERYDASLTFTKDHAKLPAWLTVMSESAEITETMLTKDVISAVEKAGESLEYLIITDQPIDKPMKLDETAPKKRIHLSLQLPHGGSKGGYESTLPLFHTFLRLPDHLAASAHFRPEVNRKVAATREAEIKKLRKVGEREAEEERVKGSEKIKREERDRRMRGMSAEEQRKFLEKESAREQKRRDKRMTKKA